MSRSTSYIGLTKEAKEFLKENAIVEPHTFNNGYGECTIYRPVGVKTGECGMFDEYELKTYILKDESEAEEFVQFSPWASGPWIFLGLRIGERVIGWTEEQVDLMMES
jgi:hypothetical protein